jgi:sugar lactone lactonase YvrE
VALLLAALVSPAAAVETRFWEVAGSEEFLQGDLPGVALTAGGEIVLAPDLDSVPLTVGSSPPPPFVWRAARDHKGNLYLGSGIRGAVYRVTPAGEVSLFFTVPELEVHALAIDSKDRLLVGSSPSGRVYRVTPEGKGESFFDPQERYIWDLVVGRNDTVYVATGEHGMLFKVDANGEGKLWFDADEPHLVSLAIDVDDSVLVGSSGTAIIYRISPDGTPRTLFDADGQEVAGVAVLPSGLVFAAVNTLIPPEKKPREERQRNDPEETLAGETSSAPPALAGVEDLTGRGDELPVGRPQQDALKLRSAIYRIPATGDTTKIWESADEGVHCLLVTKNEQVLFGTGVPARLRRIDAGEENARLLARFPESQLTALAAGDRGGVVALTSNQGRMYRATSEFGESGDYLSVVRDAGGSAHWGRVAWSAEAEAGARVEIATRSGNSARPDATWSDWSPAASLSTGTPIGSPPGRYLQFRARLSRLGDAPTPSLHSVSISYREANLSPTVTDVRVAPPAPTDAGADAPREGTPAALKITWSGTDPNGDALTYEVSTRREAAGTAQPGAWQRLARGLRETTMSWDTASIPAGRYRVRVRASDAADNDEATALSREASSEPVVVDREAPRLEIVSTSGSGGLLRATLRATDAVSAVVRCDLALDDRPGIRVSPADGLDDEGEERYEISLPGLTPGSHQLRITIRDREGNRASQSITVEVQR